MSDKKISGNITDCSNVGDILGYYSGGICGSDCDISINIII